MRISRQNEKVTISIVGAGSRAGGYINVLEVYYPDKFRLVAIAEPEKAKQQLYKDKYYLKEEMIFDSYEDFVKMPRLSDVVIISTLDDMHFIPTIKSIEKGYDIILEKPISMSLEEVLEIGRLTEKHPEQFIAVCHVLRHSPFFRKIKEILNTKQLGRIIDIQHNENIGYYHFAHSYVRGNWRNTKIAAPLVVAKSCHDMDIILYLLGNKHCERLSSMGNLTYFNGNNYDEKSMAPRCSACKIEHECPYSALKIYSGNKIRSIVFDNSTMDNLIKELDKSIYGRCVFACDNDVCDHQVTILEFDSGIHATFNMSAFTDKIHRSLKIMCEYGEIRAIETTKEIEVSFFGKEEKILYKVETFGGGHGGADIGFMMNFMESYLNNKPFDSTLSMSIESHIMAFLAEESRVNQGKVMNVSNIYNKYKEAGKE